MTGAGLVGVPDASELFGRSQAGEVGAAVACALEGTRPILLEIQSLVSKTDLAMPRRVGTGVDPKRLAMIVAVLGRHAGVALGAADVFVNVAGGVRIDEPGADLAVALAIASAARGVPLVEDRGVRRDRAHGPVASRCSGRTSAGGVRQAGDRPRDRAGGHEGAWRPASHPGRDAPAGDCCGPGPGVVEAGERRAPETRRRPAVSRPIGRRVDALDVVVDHARGAEARRAA